MSGGLHPIDRSVNPRAGGAAPFALMCVVCLVWIVTKVPETKGRTLEEIEAMWVRGGGAESAADDPGGRSGAWEPVESGSS